jgi:2-succinyl-6-hydroxy-2,4-cyclohexadiene-1-carboxylate synthase
VDTRTGFLVHAMPTAATPDRPVLHVARLVRGDRRRVPLVLLHGFTGDVTTWERLVPQLSADRTVLAVDLVGHGRSEAPDDPRAYTMDATVAAVLAAVAAVAGAVATDPIEGGGTGHAVTRAGTDPFSGGPRAHWLGYSMGGRVSMNLAITAPAVVASLTLIGASPGIADPSARAERARADEALADRIERDGIAAFVDLWMDNPLFATQARLGADYLAAARAQRLRNRPHALALTLRGMGTGAMRPLWDRVDAIHAPVLLVNGAEDPKFDAITARMGDRLPRARRLVVPAAGHAVHVEAPDVLAAALRSFLRNAERE